MYVLLLFLIALFCGTLHLTFSKKPPTFPRVIEIYLSYILPISIGLSGLISFVAHIFYAPQAAALIGWPADNPFQSEIGMVNLAIGTAGILCIWLRKNFWLATALITSIFIFGAAYVHITEIANGNRSPYNAGIFLYAGDIIIPLIYLTLVLIYAYQNRLFKKI